MINYYKQFIYFLIYLTIFSCGEKPNTPDRTEVELTITDANGAPITGIGNGIYLLGNEPDYEEAFRSKGTSKSLITPNSIVEKGGGVYTFFVENIRDATPFSYYLYVYKFDNSNNVNFSNFALDGAIKRLPSRAKVYLKTKIIPDDGNLVFYSSASNLMPITVTVTNFDTPLYTETKVISQVFSSPGTPNFIDNLSSAWFNYDPGKYTYYAKSNDGCVWQGLVNLSKGLSSPVSLSKCPNGKISFFTQNFNASILPLVITINGINASTYYVKTLISASNLNLSGNDCNNLTQSDIVIFTQNEGFYQYFAESQSGNCAWTGIIKLGTDVCTFVGFDDCGL